MLIDLKMNPSPQDGFIVAQNRSFLKPRRSGKSETSHTVALEHAKASAALAASFKSWLHSSTGWVSVLVSVRFEISCVLLHFPALS